MITTSPPSGHPIALLRARPGLLKGLSVMLTLACLQLLTGCSYYRIQSVPAADDQRLLATVSDFNDAEKYIVLHWNGGTFHLDQAEVDADLMEVRGIPVHVTDQHRYEHAGLPDKAYRYRKALQNPLNEVHLYLDADVSLVRDQPLRIPLGDITDIAQSNPARGRSAGNILLGVVGGMALLAIIVALTKSSCPFLYAETESGWVFQGELYPGNIIENAQRTDYLPLGSLKDSDGRYRLRITNELREIQHTDQAVLMVLDHPDSVSVFLDPEGKFQTLSDPRPPVSAVADGYRNVLESLEAADQRIAAFDSPIGDSDGTRNLSLTFERPESAHSAKLLLTAKNSLWLDFAFGQFYEQFGSAYSQFQRRQQGISYEEASQWKREQSLPLTVWVATSEGWMKQAEIPATGPLAFRDLVIPLDLSEAPAGPVSVRLQTGFKFWDLDRAAIDYTKNSCVSEVRVVPSSAMDDRGNEVGQDLASQDGSYVTQDHVGSVLTVEYAVPPRTDTGRTVFLQNAGFYTYLRDYSGAPDLAELQKFREPGHFTRFTEQRYNQMVSAAVRRIEPIAQTDGN